ncbi:MDR family oxidoreductase [Azorhizobium caulinodans]|nr:MDR family oxidoreductase [Azorhizobium caulinodans]
MSTDTFKAIVARKAEGGQSVALEQADESLLPAADVTVDVAWSTLNYKDGLALKGLGRILRTFPMAPGIDFAGTVRTSDSPEFKPGDQVILTGWGVGETWSGGFSARARARSEWLVKLPEGMSPRQAMAIGTAGFTAMLCVMALERHGIETGGEVLVTGAAGGVGSIAVRLLSRLGYRVVALTGRPEEAGFLTGLGASEILDRAVLQAPGKPMQSERWAGVVDTVGGTILANAIAATKAEGAVAACGLAGGTDLPTTVLPFILRGVCLLGVNSVDAPMARRQDAWARLARELTPADLDGLTQEVALEDVLGLADDILAGKVRGRTVVRI